MKHSKSGKVPPPMEFRSIPEEEKLCPVVTLDHYIEITRPFREENKVKNLLLSYVRPHKFVTKSTVGRWIKKMLSDARIDTIAVKRYSSCEKRSK